MKAVVEFVMVRCPFCESRMHVGERTSVSCDGCGSVLRTHHVDVCAVPTPRAKRMLRDAHAAAHRNRDAPFAALVDLVDAFSRAGRHERNHL